MTSVLPDDENNVTRLKRKSHTVLNKQCSDESRTFLTFSRENLSMSSCSELEQGFNRSSRLRCCCLCKKQTLLSCAALFLALCCTVLELWKLRKVVANARDIEEISRDMESLKHRFLEKDLLDELRAFEEQLYGGDTDDEDNESVSSNGDYDPNYDDSPSPQPSTTTPSSSFIVSSTTTRPCTSKDLEDALAMLRKAEDEQNVRHHEQLLEKERKRGLTRMSVEHMTNSEKKKRNVNFHTRLKQQPKK
ncbi:uncharacterized protein LOC131669384 [Phymastichus coffea]|uniref:uncharacterized protein LOC131669384 n=1 Tax=Phymastichus coffea TaxID=108790 RepID=UPI00273BEE80|nr:uncharacterized protein LOC131669384 [Phymastichus coffea]XP_058800200.1 uncharacterized protein LOC131669384 [Phymastichus coffea]XP_058800201.1 uncharacterized protein LOC131669384 [Phymastichus coffea]